ncbi:MAG: methyltransferase domain-containing protein [Planctomycetes bacterium]|nr:methyltransferase domain-containing protein [Planctomycetota bacterium]
MTSATACAPHDFRFEKYDAAGAYHWREIGRHLLWHNAFTAERYRRTLAEMMPLRSQRVLDYGCGDGALLGMICRHVGAKGEAHGFDPNGTGLRLASQMLSRRGHSFTLHAQASELPDSYFDRVICAEVIEHVVDVEGLIAGIHRILKPGGRAIITTPVRLTQHPLDPNHVREWFPDEFKELFQDCPLKLCKHELVIPAAAAEVYFWRPWLFLRVPVFRLLCNALSICCQVNALSWLRLRPRLYMQQYVVLERSKP